MSKQENYYAQTCYAATLLCTCSDSPNMDVHLRLSSARWNILAICSTTKRKFLTIKDVLYYQMNVCDKELATPTKCDHGIIVLYESARDAAIPTSLPYRQNTL